MQWLAGTQGPTAQARVLDLLPSRPPPHCVLFEESLYNQIELIGIPINILIEI